MENENEMDRITTKNVDFIKSQNIIYNENLSGLRFKSDVKLKSLEDICNRAFACVFAIQVAIDINKNDYEESLNFFKPKLEELNLSSYLNSKEKRLFDGTYSRQDAIDMDWAYESVWSLLYALGFVDDIKNASQICDCNFVIGLFSSCGSVDELKNKCKLRNINDILEAYDLYYRYHWACVEKKIHPEVNIGNLNISCVVERRRGLEWLISDVADWYDIVLHT